MSNASAGVREFHENFGFPTRSLPTQLPADEQQLRKTLIEEEAAELVEAIEQNDLQAIAKEAADLLYVVYGLQWHVGVDFDAAFDLVHESNMSKLWPVECSHCDSTGVEPLHGKNRLCIRCDGAMEPRYREDGKAIKPPSYEAPDMSSVA